MDILGIKSARHSEIVAASKSARVWADIYKAYGLLNDKAERELFRYLTARGFRIPSATVARIAARAIARAEA